MKLRLSRSTIKSLVLLNGITYLSLAILSIAYIGFGFWSFSLFPMDYCLVSLVFSVLDLIMFFLSGGVAIGIFLTRKNISESKQLWESVTFLILIIMMVSIFCFQSVYQIIRISLSDIRVNLLIRENDPPIKIVILNYLPVGLISLVSIFFCFCHLFVAILNYFHSKKEFQKNSKNNENRVPGTGESFRYDKSEQVMLLDGSEREMVDSDDSKSVNSSFLKSSSIEGNPGDNNIPYATDSPRPGEDNFEEDDGGDDDFFEDGY